jgi:NAD(P)-dependent dehydrogenase (short-subunit alcohol dehydrogenase family)
MQLVDQGALVTGGASGLGRATAKALAAAGARVAILDLDGDRAAAVAAAIGGLAFAADVADEAQVARALAEAARCHGPPRLVVNCAGIGRPGRIVGRGGPLPLAAFADHVRVNLVGTFNVLRLAAAAMLAAEPLAGGERGLVINTASVAAFEGQTGQAAYAASKGGVAALTLPAARELGRHGVRVVAIAPGVFRTPMLAPLAADAQEALARATPFPPRLGDPACFARLVIEVAGNVMLNGCTLRLDGGLRLG